MATEIKPETHKLFFLKRDDGKFFFVFESTAEADRPLLLSYLLGNDDFLEAVGDIINDVKEHGYPVLLMLHSAEELLQGQSRKIEGFPFGQELLADSGGNIDTPKIPIIHISLTDLFVDSLFGTDPLPILVPRSYMVMDNSIWNYLVPLSDIYYIHNLPEYNRMKEEDKKFVRETVSLKERFFGAVESIYRNYEKGLYYLKVAKEYADLNARLVHEDYLSGAHASGVSPFIFHSEGTTRQLLMRESRSKDDEKPKPGEKYQVGSMIDRIKQHKWRILLLDDKADSPMDTDGNERNLNASGKWNTKCQIINNILQYQLELKDNELVCRPCLEELKDNKCLPKNDDIVDDKGVIIVIEYAQSFIVAQKALKNRQYDLLLLDYLLNESSGETRYGYELLEDIYRDQGEKSKKDGDDYKFIKGDKHHRLYCMFISAYSSAVHDRLLAEGLNQSEKYWFINIGACPTNTPQLFLYNLLKLMDKRLDDCGVDDLTTMGIFKMMSKIFTESNNQIRVNSSNLYYEVLDLQRQYRGVLSAASNYDENSPFDGAGSVLMSHFIYNNAHLGGLLEHIGQLVHLAAYGTIRQWPEMWEEYVYFHSQFDERCMNDHISPSEGERNKLYQSIESHISNMKNADR